MFIEIDPKNDVYKNLIDLAFDVCNEFILVVRKNLDLNEYAKIVLEKLKGSLKEMKEESIWASGQLFGQTAFVYHYNTDNQARAIIKECSNSLHSWVQPNLPEDLSFIKNDKAWLINTAHEYESYIETEDEEEIDKIIKIKGLKVKLKYL
ncbi:stage III sporulation protein AH [Clostridium estertheticum]|uniref:stage III sporulation protein AH n=1 Tax=Clostridium estertheticum TaxID=238834 RepID=UPI0013E92B1C|nr:stage III sporulation protein AH [Clostridium estertheticum]MBZ9687345.1 stage III sporulation protein AH [Clostridium estertheticum]